jgi:hypothetical protein
LLVLAGHGYFLERRFRFRFHHNHLIIVVVFRNRFPICPRRRVARRRLRPFLL